MKLVSIFSFVEVVCVSVVCADAAMAASTQQVPTAPAAGVFAAARVTSRRVEVGDDDVVVLQVRAGLRLDVVELLRLGEGQ